MSEYDLMWIKCSVGPMCSTECFLCLSGFLVEHQQFRTLD